MLPQCSSILMLGIGWIGSHTQDLDSVRATTTAKPLTKLGYCLVTTVQGSPIAYRIGCLA